MMRTILAVTAFAQLHISLQALLPKILICAIFKSSGNVEEEPVVKPHPEIVHSVPSAGSKSANATTTALVPGVNGCLKSIINSRNRLCLYSKPSVVLFVKL